MLCARVLRFVCWRFSVISFIYCRCVCFVVSFFVVCVYVLFPSVECVVVLSVCVYYAVFGSVWFICCCYL